MNLQAADGSPLIVPVIAIAAVHSRILVAVPGKFWHRTVKNRLLPAGALSKVNSISVSAVVESERDHQADDIFIKVWLGLLAPELESNLVFGELSQDAVSSAFPTEDGTLGFVPYALALSQLADDRYSFLTAESEMVEQDTRNRLARLEEAILNINTSLQSLRSQKGPVVETTQPAAAPRNTAKSSNLAPEKAHVESGLAGVDPHTAQAALKAGVERQHLEALGQMLLGHRPHLPDAPRTAKAKVDVLGEPLDEVNEPESQLPLHEPEDPMQSALVKLTSIVETLASAKKVKGRSLEDTLDDFVGHSEVSSSSSCTGNRRHSAVLATLRRAMKDCPEEIFAVVEQNMLRDCGLVELSPGLSAHQTTFRGWCEHRSRVPNIPGTVRMLWAVCGALDSLRAHRVEEAKAKLALLISAIDQVACDRGSWILGSEILLEESPPLSNFGKHVPPEAFECQHSRLLPSSWMEAMMHKVKEVDDFAEKKAKLGKKAKLPSPPGLAQQNQEEEKGKGKGKYRARQRGSSAQNQGEEPGQSPV